MLELIQISDDIRRYRRERDRRRQWEREWHDQRYHAPPRRKQAEGRVSEREFIYEQTRGGPRR